jgi:hypothetical protein
MLIARPLQALVISPHDLIIQPTPWLLAVRFNCAVSLGSRPLDLSSTKRDNAGLQLRRAISIQAEGERPFEKHAIAPSAARLCWATVTTKTNRPEPNPSADERA